MRRDQNLDPDDLDRPDWNSLKSNYDKHDVGEAYLIGRLNQMGLQAEHWGIDMRHDDDGLIFDNKMDLRLWKPLDDQEHPPDAPDDLRPRYERRVLDGDHRAYELAMERDLEPDERRIDREEWDLRGVVDVKTKANPDWLGVLNLRHLAHYAEHAAALDQYDVPVFLYFTMVDMDTETVGERNIIVPVPTDWPFETVAKHFDRDSGRSIGWPRLKDMVAECSIVDRTFRAPDGNPVVQTDEDAWLDFEWVEDNIQ